LVHGIRVLKWVVVGKGQEWNFGGRIRVFGKNRCVLSAIFEVTDWVGFWRD
jgi:hypothetical protein